MAPIVFDAEFDPLSPLVHAPFWATDIIVARDQGEQRRSLRRIPGNIVEFSVSAIDAAGMAHIDSLLQAGAPDGYKVPLWYDRRPLTEVLPVGSFSISFPTAGYSFVEGEELLLWTSPSVWEVIVTDAVTATSVGFLTATTREWRIGALIVPLRNGFLVEAVNPSRLSRDGQSTPLKFVLGSWAEPGVSIAVVAVPCSPTPAPVFPVKYHLSPSLFGGRIEGVTFDYADINAMKAALEPRFAFSHPSPVNAVIDHSIVVGGRPTLKYTAPGTHSIVAATGGMFYEKIIPCSPQPSKMWTRCLASALVPIVDEGALLTTADEELPHYHLTFPGVQGGGGAYGAEWWADDVSYEAEDFNPGLGGYPETEDHRFQNDGWGEQGNTQGTPRWQNASYMRADLHPFRSIIVLSESGVVGRHRLWVNGILLRDDTGATGTFSILRLLLNASSTYASPTGLGGYDVNVNVSLVEWVSGNAYPNPYGLNLGVTIPTVLWTNDPT